MIMIPVARPAVSDSELSAVGKVFESRWLGLGKVVEEFEHVAAKQIDAPRMLATNTGTTALHLALATIGVGPSDEVILPSLTFVATAQAILAAGATPVLCDVDPKTLNVDPQRLEAVRTEFTKAVIPVHYRGLPVDIDAILEWASPYGIRTVEDAAHAYGSLYEDGTPVGARGDVTCFSFDPIKNITAGEGGGIVFANEVEHDRAVRIRALGIDSSAWSRLESRRPWQYDVVDIGFRYHMPNFCASIGLAQLKRFEEFRRRKQSILATYQKVFHGHSALTMLPMPVERVFPFLALVIVDKRDAFMEHMQKQGIGTGVHYIPIHNFSHFSAAVRQPLEATNELGDRICSLPLLNDQTDDERDRVIEAVLAFDR